MVFMMTLRVMPSTKVLTTITTNTCNSKHVQHGRRSTRVSVLLQSVNSNRRTISTNIRKGVTIIVNTNRGPRRHGNSLNENVAMNLHEKLIIYLHGIMQPTGINNGTGSVTRRINEANSVYCRLVLFYNKLYNLKFLYMNKRNTRTNRRRTTKRSTRGLFFRE